MKRPSGFDRLPERQPEPEPEQRRPEIPEAARPETFASGSFISDRFSAARSAAEPSPASQVATETAASSETPSAPPSTRSTGAATETDPAAPTVDLSELRDDGFETAAGGAGLVERARRASLSLRGPARDADPVKAAERRLRAAERRRKARIQQERRRFSAAGRRRRRNWFIVLGAVLGLALFVTVGVFTPLMAVQQVEVIGADKVERADVEQALSRFEGRPLALIEDRDVHVALEPFPMIQRYAVERVPPHTLLVRIEERVPVISVKRGERYFSYDAAGVMLGSSKKPRSAVPVASGSVKDFSSPAFESAARALRDMPRSLRKQIVKVRATSAQDVTFTLDSGIRVVWGDADLSRRKALVLEKMLGALEDEDVDRIDVSSTEAPVFD